MSKEFWLRAHEKAVEELMELGLTWDEAYESEQAAKRADELSRDRIAAMADQARMEQKDKAGGH